jgi:Predicted N-acetylglucosamine kinase
MPPDWWRSPPPRWSPSSPAPGCITRRTVLGAARAVCGREKGIAVILGTGSNSCLYDGQQIVRNIRPGGFILGDEGSGAVLGKSFLSDLIKGLVPEDTAAAYAAEGYPADYPSIVREVYKSAAPAAFMGSLAPWIVGRYEEDDYLKGLVDITSPVYPPVLLQYGAEAPVGVVGGFGCACKPVLQRLGREAGLSFTTFLPSPMEGLVAYHYGL